MLAVYRIVFHQLFSRLVDIGTRQTTYQRKGNLE